MRSRLKGPVVALLVAAGLLLCACKPPPPITYNGETFTAHGWQGPDPTESWETVFAVYASSDPAAPAIAGSYVHRGKSIIFTPTFPIGAGVSLRAIYHPAEGEVVIFRFNGPQIDAPAATTKVTALYPTTSQWPANMLRFYIQFSAPMKEGVAWAHLRLEDEQGNAVHGPFVEIDQELWSPDKTRLTVLFDPGRIKRGLVDNMNAGPPLVPGRGYTLVVDKTWPDAWGRPIGVDFRKPITATADVREPVDPKTWRISAPADAHSPLVITFPRPLDHALALRVITVPDMPGSARLEADDTRWVFTPNNAWNADRYQVRVDGVIEDISGNRLHRLFDVDVDVAGPDADMRTPPFELLEFTAKG